MTPPTSLDTCLPKPEAPATHYHAIAMKNQT